MQGITPHFARCQTTSLLDCQVLFNSVAGDRGEKEFMKSNIKSGIKAFMKSGIKSGLEAFIKSA